MTNSSAGIEDYTATVATADDISTYSSFVCEHMSIPYDDALDIGESDSNRIVNMDDYSLDSKTLVRVLDKVYNFTQYNGQQLICGGQYTVSLSRSHLYNVNQEVCNGGESLSNLIVGRQTILRGGWSDYDTISGYQYISSGGTATMATIFGRQYVCEGGFARDTVVNSGGYLLMDRDAEAYNVNLQEGAYLIYSSRTTVTGKNYRGSFFVSNGIASNIIVEDDGYHEVAYGESAFNIFFEGSARQDVAYSAYLSGTVLNNGVFQYVGGTVEDVEIKSGGWMELFSNGRALDIRQEEGGAIVLSKIINGDGTVLEGSNHIGSFYYRNGILSNFYLTGDEGRASFNVMSAIDIVQEKTIIAISGWQEVSSGVANSTTICSSGRQYLYESAIANHTVINGGSQQVTTGTVANNTVINSGGVQGILALGSANSTVINDSGSQYVMDSGQADNTVINSGGSQELWGNASGTVINDGGCQEVMPGSWREWSSGSLVSQTMCSAVSTTINSGGSQIVSGVAVSATISSGGTQYLKGTARNTTIKNGGVQIVSSSTGLLLNKDELFNLAEKTTIESGGLHIIESGGISDNIDQKAGGAISVDVIGGDSATKVSGSHAKGSFSLSSGVAKDFVIYKGGSMNLINSGIAEKIAVSGGLMNVYAGCKASKTTIAGGGSATGSQVIFQQGLAISTTINSGGAQTILAGGSSSETTVGNGGSQIIRGASGNIKYGIATETKITGGVQYVYGGYADGTTIGGNGEQHIYVNGTAIGTEIGKGEQYIHAGGTARNTEIKTNGMQLVMNQAHAYDTFINGKGYQHIYYGGLAEKIYIVSNGIQYVHSGGRANLTSLGSGGSQIINYGGIAVSNHILKGGKQFVGISASANPNFSGNVDSTYAGGVVINTIISSGGLQEIHVSGIASMTTISNGGCQYVFSGGLAKIVDLYDGGVMEIKENGSAVNINQSSGGNVNFELTANDQSYVQGINENGVFRLANGVASNFAVYDSGWIKLKDGALLDTAAVHSGGGVFVSSGGSATNITQVIGGNINVEVSIDYADFVSGTNALGNTFTLDNGIASNFIIYSGGIQTVLSGGLALNTTVSAGGMQKVSSGGSSLDVVQNFGGNIMTDLRAGDMDTVISGINAYGDDFYISGGHASNFVLFTSAHQKVSSGAAAFGTVINDGAIQEILVGGSSLDILQVSGGNINVQVNGANDDTYVGGINALGSNFSLSNGVADNFLIFNSGVQKVNSGGSAINTIIFSGGSQSVASNGFIDGTIVESGGSLSLEKGAAIDGLIGIDGAASISITGEIQGAKDTTYISLDLSDRDKVEKIVINGIDYLTDCIFEVNVAAAQAKGNYIYATVEDSILSPIYLYVDGIARIELAIGEKYMFGANSYIQFSDKGGVLAMRVMGSAVISGVTLEPEEQYILSSSSQVAYDFIVNSGRSFLVKSGATAIGTEIYNGGEMVLMLAATAEQSVINSGGSQTVWSSAKTSYTQINANGVQFVHSGGTALLTRVEAGGTQVVSKGTASSTTVLTGGSQHVGSNATASKTLLNGYQLVSNAGKSVETTISCGGEQFLTMGGTANSSLIKSGGVLNVDNSGKVNGFTLEEGGYVFFDSSSTLSGKNKLQGGRVVIEKFVTVSAGTELTFDLTKRNGSEEYILGNMNYFITGLSTAKVLITINVNKNQTAGTYKLASNAGEFNHGVTLTVDGVKADTLSFNSWFLHNGVSYKITTNVDDELILQIDDSRNIIFGRIVSHEIFTVTGSSIASNTIVREEGNLNVNAGGVTISTIISASGSETVGYGGMTSKSVVSSGGSQLVNSGGIAKNTIIYSGGTQEVYGLAANVRILSGGEQRLFGTATQVTISGGLQRIIGGSADSVNVNSSGSVEVSSGGQINNVYVSRDAYMAVSANATISNATIYTGGVVDLSPGAIANGVIYVAGYLNVIGMTSASADLHIMIDLSSAESGNDKLIENINFLDVSDITAALGAGRTGIYSIASGTPETAVTIQVDGVECGHLYVGDVIQVGIYSYELTFADNLLGLKVVGHASGLTLDYETEPLTITSLVVADDITINDGGHLTIAAGGIGDTLLVNSNGILVISSGALLTGDIRLSGGAMVINASKKFVINSRDANIIFTVDAATYDNSAPLLQGVTQTLAAHTSYTIDVTGDIVSGSYLLADNFYWNELSQVSLWRDGESIALFEKQGTWAPQYYNGYYFSIVNNPEQNKDTLYLQIEEINDASVRVVKVGESITGVLVRSSEMHVFGTAIDATLLYGTQIVFSGGVTSNTHINSKGVQHVSSGGEAYGTEINSIGGQYIRNGGIAFDAIINPNGYQWVKSGGIASATTVKNGGRQHISSGGISTNTTVEYGGRQLVSAYGYAEGVELYGEQHILDDGIASNVIVHSRAKQYISAYGVGMDITVLDGGTVILNNGAIIGGNIDLFGGSLTIQGNLTVFSGTRVTFNVSEDNSDMPVSISDLNKLSTASFSIKVGDDISEGDYILTTGASGFTGVFTLKIGEVSTGTLSVGGMLAINDKQYSLSIENDILSLKVAAATGNIYENLYVNGEMTISSGVSVFNTKVVDNGLLMVSSGGIVSDTVISSGGTQEILSGGLAKNTFISSGGWMEISSGGIASGTTIYSGASQLVAEGGKAYSVIISRGGVLRYESGASVWGLSSGNQGALDGDVIGGDSNTFIEGYLSGGIASNMRVSSGMHQNVYSSGAETHSTYIVSGGTQTVSDHAASYDTTVYGVQIIGSKGQLMKLIL